MFAVPDEVAAELTELAAAHPNAQNWNLSLWLNNWRNLINELGKYPSAIAHEYMNDLGVRDQLMISLGIAHSEGKAAALAWALPILEDLDSQFVEKTTPDIDGLIWGPYLEPNMWWRRRVPPDEGLLMNLQQVGPEMRGYEYQ